MNSVWTFVVNQWDSWPVQLTVWGLILVLLVVVAVFVLRKLRDSSGGSVEDPGQLVTNFREMKLQGDITDKEFRTINSLLNAKQTPPIKHTQDST